MKLSNMDGMNIIDRYDEDVDGHLFESDTGKLVYYYHYEVLKQQYDGVFQAFKNVCNQRDQLEAINAELKCELVIAQNDAHNKGIRIVELKHKLEEAYSFMLPKLNLEIAQAICQIRTMNNDSWLYADKAWSQLKATLLTSGSTAKEKYYG